MCPLPPLLQAVVQSFQGLGIDFDVSKIQLVREPSEQVCAAVWSVIFDMSGPSHHSRCVRLCGV